MKCVQCGAEIDHPEEARFCSACGGALLGPDEQPDPEAGEPLEDGLDEAESVPARPEQARAEFSSAVREALADGVVDARDRQALDDASRRLHLPGDDVSQLTAEVMEEAGGAASGAPEGRQAPVVLEINDNHFYMEKRAGVLDVRLAAPTGAETCRFRLSLKGNFLGTHDWKGRLSGGKTARRKFQVVPGVGGEHLLDLMLELERDREVKVWTAQPTLKVLMPDDNPSNVTVVLDQRMESGRNIGYGLSIQNELKEGFAKGMLRDVNDLLRQQFSDHWSRLPLVEDVDRTAELSRLRQGRVHVIGGPDSREPLERLALVPRQPETPGCVLLGRSAITIGRQRNASDIVLRKYPRSPANDTRTLQLSGCHVTLALEEEGLAVRDHDTLNGTVLNGSPVKGREVVPLNQPSELELARAFRLRIIPYAEDSRGSQRDRYAELGLPDELWRTAEQLRLRSILIESVDDPPVIARHLVVLRWINAGCRVGNEVVLPGPCPSRLCMRIVRLGGTLWLEGMTESGCLELAGRPIAAGEAVALPPEGDLCCSHACWDLSPEGLTAGSSRPHKPPGPDDKR